MGYLPQFKNDLFISYRHAANEGRENWVDEFCDALRASLVELVGDVSLWRDGIKLKTGDAWRPEIAEAVNDAAIFLAIISRTYLDSDECRKELDLFLGHLKDENGTGQRRILPIFKQPLKPEQRLPRELGELHRHEFFRWDPPGSPRFRELGPNPDGADTREFWATLGRLSQDIMITLEELRGQARARALGNVFVARVGPELSTEREMLRSDLQQRGYVVVPEREYLWNADDLHDNVDRDLAEARLCIHLVARTQSIEPDTAERARLQLTLAHAAMKARGRTSPLVWIQPAAATHPSSESLIEFIESDLANEGVAYWRGGFEELKTQIYDYLPAATAVPAAPPIREVALLVEDAEVPALGPLKALLVEKLAVDPQPVKLKGAAPKDLDRAQRTLDRCAQCLLFWSTQPEDWVQDVLSQGVLANRLGRDRMCVYAAAPPTPEKSAFQSAKARTIMATADLNEAELRKFLPPA